MLSASLDFPRLQAAFRAADYVVNNFTNDQLVEITHVLHHRSLTEITTPLVEELTIKEEVCTNCMKSKWGPLLIYHCYTRSRKQARPCSAERSVRQEC